MSLQGKIAIITGAGSGVGLAAATIFAEAGCQVVATARQASQLEQLSRLGDRITPMALEITDEKNWQDLIEAVETKFGGVDILFNNAGATVRGGILETDLAKWDLTLATNTTSVFLGCQAVIPSMLKRGGGAIVNHASINAIRGNYNLVAYCASKAAVDGLTRALALDYAAQGIRVNCLCSAAIDTPMTHSYLAASQTPDALLRAINEKHPIGRMATAEEVAQAALFLASPASSYITGTTLPVDGGRSIR